MARITAFGPIQNWSVGTAYGDLLQADERTIIISDGVNTSVYGGRFSLDAYGNLAGTLSRFEQRVNGATVVEATDFSVDASLAYNAINSGQADTLISLIQASNDELFGSSFADGLKGYDGNDYISGRGGNDVLLGSAGNDTLDGGAGVDTADYSEAFGGVAVYLLHTGRNVGGGEGVDRLISIENLTGSAYGDRLVGDSGSNRIEGGAGDDIIKGKGGNDTLFGQDGNDRVIGWLQDDTLYGGAGSDLLGGLSGNDWLDGGEGDDFLYGGRDADTVLGGGGDDKVRGNRGNDDVQGGVGNDDVRGGGGNDLLRGDAGNDYVMGENGSDILDGGSGNDTLIGGYSDDAGDGYRDTFVFASSLSGGGGFDKVRDFEDGIDVLDLRSWGFSDFSQVAVLATETAGALVIDFNADDQLKLGNFSLTSFDSSDVLLA